MSVSATGTLAPIDTVEVGTQVSGTIASLGADFNNTVKRGQVVATLDPAVLSSQVQQAEDRPFSDDMAALLRQRHRLQPRDADDFTIRSPEEMAAVLTSTTTTMSWLLSGVAAISLIVGGVGIMNIMLVSVTERTREIGLRRAIGARRADVLAQFLIEAMALSLLGGATGVLAGVGASYALTAVMNWSTVVSTASILMSFGFAALVGVVFGFVPARRAASLNPREALHYE